MGQKSGKKKCRDTAISKKEKQSESIVVSNVRRLVHAFVSVIIFHLWCFAIWLAKISFYGEQVNMLWKILSDFFYIITKRGNYVSTFKAPII